MSVEKFLTESRVERIKSVVSSRQFNLTVVLENIHDAHNIAAVIRSCDAVGIAEIYVLITDDRVDVSKYELKHKTISSGSHKWVKVNIYREIEPLIKDLRKKYDRILGTHLSQESVSLYDIDFSESIALVYGNEHAGISEELLAELDGNFIIPQYGMVQSLNISVACAVSLFEALRQKEKSGAFNDGVWTENHQELFDHYIQSSKPRITKKLT